MESFASEMLAGKQLLPMSAGKQFELKGSAQKDIFFHRRIDLFKWSESARHFSGKWQKSAERESSPRAATGVVLGGRAVTGVVLGGRVKTLPSKFYLSSNDLWRSQLSKNVYKANLKCLTPAMIDRLAATLDHVVSVTGQLATLPTRHSQIAAHLVNSPFKRRPTTLY